MDGFTYHNLFDTKGIEYLIVIAFLILIIPFWRIINSPARQKSAISKLAGSLTPAMLRIPEGIYYGRNHAWAFLEKNGTAMLGMDDLLMHITGSVRPVFNRVSGEMIKKGDILGELVHNGKSLKISSPISGEIVALNDINEENKDILSTDPYGEGWLVRVKPSDWVKETGSFYFAKQAVSWFSEEVSRVKDFMAEQARSLSPEPSLLVLQDGGELADNILADLPAEVWSDFEKSFLKLTVE
jgi:glycine cleavage system H protein